MGVVALTLALAACGDKGQGATGRGVPKVAGKGTKPGVAADAGAKAAPKPPPRGLPSAFRGGKSREQVVKMLPPLLGRGFHSSLVAFEARKLVAAWAAVSRHLAQGRLGKMILRELERERRRAGALLPADLAEAERWGISLDGPAFVALHSRWRRTVVGYSVSDRSKFKQALRKLHDRGRGAPLRWEVEADTKPPLTALRQGSRLRAVCRFSRGFALCGRAPEAIDGARSGQGSLWDDLDKGERAALANQSGLFTLGGRRAAMLSFWRLDDKQRMHVSGRVGGRKLARVFAQIKPKMAPRFANIAGKVATAWARLPVDLARVLDPKKHGLDGKLLAAGFDGELALVEGAGGEVALVLGVRDRKVAKKVVAGLLKQLQRDGLWSNLSAFAVRKRKQLADKTLGRYELLEVRSTEPLLKALKLRLAVIWGQGRLVIGTPGQALALAAGKPQAVKRDRGKLLDAKLPLGDLFAPMLVTMPKLLEAMGARMRPYERDFMRMLPRSFRRGALRVHLKGGWLHGEGRLDVAPGGRHDAQTGSAARAGLWALTLFLSRVERSMRVRSDLFGLRWRLSHYVRKHQRLPPGKTGWLPKKRCCKLPGAICPRSALQNTPLGKAGFRTYSTAHQWRYTSNKKGDKASLEARADLDCDGRFATHKVEVELVKGRVKVGPVQSKRRFE